MGVLKTTTKETWKQQQKETAKATTKIFAFCEPVEKRAFWWIVDCVIGRNVRWNLSPCPLSTRFPTAATASRPSASFAVIRDREKVLSRRVSLARWPRRVFAEGWWSIGRTANRRIGVGTRGRASLAKIPGEQQTKLKFRWPTTWWATPTEAPRYQ